MFDMGLPFSLLWLELLLVEDLWLIFEPPILLSDSGDEEVDCELLLSLPSFLGEGKDCLSSLVLSNVSIESGSLDELESSLV